MIKFKKSIKIDAPLEQVFAYFSNPSNLPEIWPSMVEVKNIVAHNGNRGYDYVYKMAGMRFEGHSETLEFEPNERIMTQSKKGIQSVFVYSFSNVEGMTKVSIQVEYEIPNKVLARLAEPLIRRLNEREATTVLKNLKDRMEHAIPTTIGAGMSGTQPRIDR